MIDGLLAAITWSNLALVVLATALGVFIGALPGMTEGMGVALMVPLTFGMPPLQGLTVLAAVYAGAVYGGSITAILINTPGTSASVVTCLDGYPMARQGKAGLALMAAITASFLGGIIGGLFLMFVSPALANFALKFGPPEYFGLGVLGLTMVAVISRGSMIKGLISGGLGFLFSTVGLHPITGMVRFDFGTTYLWDGIPLIPTVIGLFALSELLSLIAKGESFGVPEKVTVKIWDAVREVLRYPGNIIRSSIIGTVVGAIPGPGTTVGSQLAYLATVRLSKHPERFGKGEIEGVISSEAANNSTAGGSLIPALTLGIPGSSVAAAFLGGLMLHGLRPGPELFQSDASTVYGLFWLYLLANVALFVLAIAGSNYFSQVTRLPVPLLGPIIFILSFVGTYALNRSMGDVLVAILFGYIGYIMRKEGYSPVGFILGLILGPITESAYLQSQLISRGSHMIYFTRPISLTLLIMAALAILWPLAQRLLNRQGMQPHT